MVGRHCRTGWRGAEGLQPLTPGIRVLRRPDREEADLMEEVKIIEDEYGNDRDYGEHVVTQPPQQKNSEGDECLFTEHEEDRIMADKVGHERIGLHRPSRSDQNDGQNPVGDIEGQYNQNEKLQFLQDDRSRFDPHPSSPPTGRREHFVSPSLHAW